MPAKQPDRVVIAHLFPDALNLYGDRGNIDTLVRRAGWRGIEAEVRGIGAGDAAALRGADVIFIGGGADQHQRAVADTLMDLADPLRRAIDEGAALLAVCAGYQNLGHAFRSPLVGEIRGPGLLDVDLRWSLTYTAGANGSSRGSSANTFCHPAVSVTMTSHSSGTAVVHT